MVTMLSEASSTKYLPKWLCLIVKSAQRLLVVWGLRARLAGMGNISELLINAVTKEGAKATDRH